jgi:hypothetical protein
MKADLNISANGTQPQYFGKWKMTSSFFTGRGAQFLFNWKTTSKLKAGKMTSISYSVKLAYLAPACPALDTAQPQLVQPLIF